MKRQLLIAITFLLSPVAQGENQPWWQGDAGYASTGGFHSELNNGKGVGTPQVNPFSNSDAYAKALGDKAKDPNAKAARPNETESDRLIRLSRIDPSLAPSARPESLAEAGKPNSPGKLGWDEKLVDAKVLAETGVAGVTAENITLAISSAFRQSDCAGDTACEATENKKITNQLNAYAANLEAFGAAKDAYQHGIHQLTRDYYKLEPKAPLGGGQAGSLVAGSVNYDDAAAGKRQGAIQAQVDQLPADTLAMFEEKNIDAADFVGKMMNGEFKSGEDLKNYFGDASEGGSGLLGKGSKPEGNAETTGETRPREAFGIDEGPVLNVPNGSIISFGAKKNGAKGSAGNSAGDDDSSLMTALANFVGAQAKHLKNTANGLAGDVTEKDRRALIQFAVKWWNTEDQPAPAIPEGARQRTIFDVAHDSYGTFRGMRAVKAGPVAFNER